MGKPKGKPAWRIKPDFFKILALARVESDNPGLKVRTYDK